MKNTIAAVCKNWGISPEAMAPHLVWLQADPLDAQGRLTREVGLEKGALVRLRRVRYMDGAFAGFYRVDTNERFTGHVSVSMRDIEHPQ